MTKGIVLLLAGMALGLTGCVNTVTQTEPGTRPSYQDRVEARYQQPVPKVFEAAKKALNSFGHVTSESQIFVGANEIRTLEGNVNGRLIYIRVEGLDSVVTSAVVQVRTKMGSTDLRTAKDLVRQIAVELE